MPARNVEDVRVGGGTAYFDSGRRPSLATLALRRSASGAARRRCSTPRCARRSRPAPAAVRRPQRRIRGSRARGRGDRRPGARGRAANDGERRSADGSPPAVAALAKRYQPTLLVTVADQNWPVSVNAILAERGPADQPVCLVQQRTHQPQVCPASRSSLGGYRGAVVGLPPAARAARRATRARAGSSRRSCEASTSRRARSTTGSRIPACSTRGARRRSTSTTRVRSRPSHVPRAGRRSERPLRPDRARVLVLLPVQLLPAGRRTRT